MNKDDRFTYFIEGEYYDDFNKTEKASHITTTSLNLELKLIRIPAFTADTSDEVKKYLLTLKSTESQSLVLDLRDNPGGLILDANEILDLLLPKCISSYLIYSDAYKYEYTSDSKMLKFKKIIVMVNENSASSSELLALSLKKHLNNVTIIGHKTFGKGVGQETYENKAKHFIILLTSFKWYVEGLNVTQTKVVPDVTLKGSSDKVYFGEVNSLVK
jgi:C-terminal peptidase prc